GGAERQRHGADGQRTFPHRYIEAVFNTPRLVLSLVNQVPGSLLRLIDYPTDRVLCLAGEVASRLLHLIRRAAYGTAHFAGEITCGVRRAVPNARRALPADAGGSPVAVAVRPLVIQPRAPITVAVTGGVAAGFAAVHPHPSKADPHQRGGNGVRFDRVYDAPAGLVYRITYTFYHVFYLFDGGFTHRL